VTTADDKSGVRIFPPLIYLAAIGVGFLIQAAVPVRLAARWHDARLGAGVAFIVIAVVIVASAVFVFRRAGTTPNPTRPTTALVLRGPYRFTRNPMYVAWVILCLGVALAANVFWVAVMAFPAAVTTQRIVIKREEAYLTRKFGDEYRAYQARVRRWV